MSFQRTIFPSNSKEGPSLSNDLAGIGFRLGGEPNYSANIEDTLLACCREALGGDYRLMSLLVVWVEVHYKVINVDRITKVILQTEDIALRRFWQAIAQWFTHDQRWSRLRERAPKRRSLLSKELASFVERNGEDSRFKKTHLIIPKKLLRNRLDDVFSPEELVAVHMAYRYRIQMGPTYRSDMWAITEKLKGQIKALDLARATYGAKDTAYEVLRSWRLVSFCRALRDKNVS
jgi:hypothetical protein